MRHDLIIKQGPFSIYEGKHGFTFNVVCQRLGKTTFRVIFEHDALADTREGALLKQLVPHAAIWAENALRTRAASLASTINANSLKGQNDAHAS